MAQRERHSRGYILDQLTEMVEYDEVDDRREEIVEFLYWLNAPRFNRREANRRLKLYAARNDEWEWLIGEPL